MTSIQSDAYFKEPDSGKPPLYRAVGLRKTGAILVLPPTRSDRLGDTRLAANVRLHSESPAGGDAGAPRRDSSKMRSHPFPRATDKVGVSA